MIDLVSWVAVFWEVGDGAEIWDLPLIAGDLATLESHCSLVCTAKQVDCAVKIIINVLLLKAFTGNCHSP